MRKNRGPSKTKKKGVKIETEQVREKWYLKIIMFEPSCLMAARTRDDGGAVTAAEQTRDDGGGPEIA